MKNGNVTNYYGAVSADFNIFNSFMKRFDYLTNGLGD